MNSSISHARWLLALDMARIARADVIRDNYLRLAVHFQALYVMQLAEENVRGKKCS